MILLYNIVVFKEEAEKPKGVSGLIEIENPNRVTAKMKKVKDLDGEVGEAQLTRRERYKSVFWSAVLSLFETF